MVFSSLLFLCAFLPLTLLLYYSSSSNPTFRNGLLIVSSLIFYAWGEPVWITLLIFTSFFDYGNARLAARHRGTWKSKAAVALSVTGNLLVLGTFKYSSFIAENVNALFGCHWPVVHFHLPIGISFYTFQSLSYVIDVYRGEVEAQKNPYKFLLFVSLFPQLVAGPIVRYKDIAQQIERRVVTLASFDGGVRRFLVGLAKKVIIANNAGDICQTLLMSDYARLPVSGAWLGIVLFAIQIYFDFSGYSDMAIGLAKMFGFTYRENFNYPYTSRSATEFWRRWHMSLGSFFRDYLYIPLGGNRKSPLRNLVIVWFLTGLWHGASWNFIVWGLFYGALIVLEKSFLLKILERVPAFLSHAYLLLAVLVGWAFFYHTDLHRGVALLRIMFGGAAAPLNDPTITIHFMSSLWLIAAGCIGSTPALPHLYHSLRTRVERWRPASFFLNDIFQPSLQLTLLVVSLLFLVGQSYNPFLYFRF